jgi:hypothetical protein
VKTFRYDLFEPTAAAQSNGTADEHGGHTGGPRLTSEFLAYDESYHDGVSLSTGWVAGAEGGAKSIVTGMLGGDGTVRAWSSGSRLDGEPGMYLEGPNHHSDGNVTFTQIASFAPFAGGPPGIGVQVATTSTTTGADILVSGAGPGGTEVRRFGLGRPDPKSTTVAPLPLGTLPPLHASTGPVPLGGR